jgi:uncharacterized HAD superfamily protein
MIIGVDLDDVLAETFIAFDQFHNSTYGTSFKREDHFTFDLSEFWNVSQEEARKRVKEFNASKYSREITPLTGAKEALSELSKKHELVIVTSRLEETKQGTKEWLEMHYPDHDFDVHFANHYYGIEHQKKSHICQNLGVDVLIDDCLEYAIECAEAKVKVLLLDNPWNQTDKLPKNVTRVKNWDDIVKRIELIEIG